MLYEACTTTKWTVFKNVWCWWYICLNIMPGPILVEILLQHAHKSCFVLDYHIEVWKNKKCFGFFWVKFLCKQYIIFVNCRYWYDIPHIIIICCFYKCINAAVHFVPWVKSVVGKLQYLVTLFSLCCYIVRIALCSSKETMQQLCQRIDFVQLKSDTKLL